jgi:hypothetical protein
MHAIIMMEHRTGALVLLAGQMTSDAPCISISILIPPLITLHRRFRWAKMERSGLMGGNLSSIDRLLARRLWRVLSRGIVQVIVLPENLREGAEVERMEDS